ncbi:MAG: fatty acid desaturase [Acidimicrobiales bacterium]
MPGRPGLWLGGMVPAGAVLPDVLPTDRLTETGMPRPFLREQLRRIPNGRNALNVASAWLQSFGLLVAVSWLTPRLPLWAALPIWAATFVLMGRAFALFAILGHEAAHRLLFSKKSVNDLVGKWLLSYPAFLPFDIYRRSHFAHHREEFGADEPDLAFYGGYPMPRASMRRKLVRDAVGISGWKNFKVLVLAWRSPTSRPLAAKITGAQVAVWAALWLATGRWWLYPLMWWAPWMTVWRVLNRLRSVAEHGGMAASKDRRKTTHVVHQSLVPRFWIVPFNTGWHLAHHVDMGVPFQHLPALHDELVAAGWVTDELEHPSYRALWRACIVD